MWKVLILICSTSLSRGECNINTASDVILPGKANSVVECMMLGQTTMAQTAIDMKGHYLLLKCSSGSPKPGANIG